MAGLWTSIDPMWAAFCRLIVFPFVFLFWYLGIVDDVSLLDLRAQLDDGVRVGLPDEVRLDKAPPLHQVHSQQAFSHGITIKFKERKVNVVVNNFKFF
jgi:hypothetical protein